MTLSKRTTKQNTTQEGPERDPRQQGSRWKIEADALHSKTFTGKVDFGTYTQSEVDSGVLARRIESMKEQGYRNIVTREIAAEEETV